MQALVELPYRQTASLEIYPAPMEGGIIPVYISKDNVYVYLSITGLDSNGNPATRPDIMLEFELEFDGNEMAKWGDYDYYDEGYCNLSINSLKPNLKAGTTIDIKVICNDNPSLSTTLTLKAIDAEGQKAMYINAVNNAIETFPEDVTFDNCLEALKIRDEISGLYPYTLWDDSDVQAAYQIYWNEIGSKTEKFTIYTDYKFDGNICTATDYRGYEEKYEYDAKGKNFPCGTYTGEWSKWSDDNGDHYNQYKIELKSDNTYQMYHRYASSEAEKETAQWNNNKAGTYKLTGDQANGGSLILKED